MRYSEFLLWNGVRFLNKKEISVRDDILGARLITVPAAPALVSNSADEFYLGALKSADFSIVDSSLLAMLSRLRRLRVYRYSGFRLLFDLLQYLRTNHVRVFLVNPSAEVDNANVRYMLSDTCLTRAEIASYVAPMYPTRGAFQDPALLRSVASFAPRVIIVGISGGKQEILGEYLSRNLTTNTTVLCTGAALSFFTGQQAMITYGIDKYYLGWLARIIANPKVFLPRYLGAVRFVFEFFRYPIETIS